jgi:YVTN family beta-propeller protein
VGCWLPALAGYTNFESSHVHPITLTPSKGRLLAVNTPDAVLEVFTVRPDGTLAALRAIPVGLEPVSVRARTDSEAWVVNSLSDSVGVVDLDTGATIRTLSVGNEPADVVFANGRAFISVSQEDAVKVYDLSNLDAAPTTVSLFSNRPRALAVSNSGDKVYAAALLSGNRTTVVHSGIVEANQQLLVPPLLTQLGLNEMRCNGAPPPRPPLPPGIDRNPELTDPAPPAKPPVGLIVKWDPTSGQWKDEAGQDWTHCLPYRLPDHDLFVLDAAPPHSVTTVQGLGTNLFEVSVNPGNGRIYVPNTDARNFVRFEHPLGVQGHVVHNQLSVVDLSAGNAVTRIDLNTHIDRASDPATNLSERLASISQPGMLVWNSTGSVGYLAAVGSRKVFRVDGACLAGSCVFGPNRASPSAVEVGEGPTGVALHEAAGRLYVLNRFSNTIAVVDAATLTKSGEVALHDPSDATVKQGRRFLYDGILSSGHGDAACSSCHISGDRDGLAWDLGNPAGDLAVYGTPGDSVRFIQPLNGMVTDCDPSMCASHAGFDPEKGPMATQTLRGMIEPLHWRGDRGTMADFNAAFVGLLGAHDIGPVNGKPAGLTASDMGLFRSFALQIQFPPNPHRNVDDTIPNQVKTIPGHSLAGNPTTGKAVFETGVADANGPCTTCHSHPAGTSGGRLGGIETGDPPSARAALFNGDGILSPHSDMKIPHLRNLHEKFGPRFGSHTNPSDPPADHKSGFGFIHDGAIPDLGTFLSLVIFTLTSQQVRDLSMFLLHFPSETRPAVGKHLTLDPGPPPTGDPGEESLLATLVSLGNLSDPGRHCELVVSTLSGTRVKTYYLDGGGGSDGLWTSDVPGEPQVSTATLRSNASAPLSFVCAPIGSGTRMGSDRDEDAHLNAEDCAPADARAFEVPGLVTGFVMAGTTTLAWDDQIPGTGPGTHYDVVGGALSVLRAGGLEAATSCLAGDITTTHVEDPLGDPPAGGGWFYLVRAENACGSGGFGPGRESLDALACPGS